MNAADHSREIIDRTLDDAFLPEQVGDRDHLVTVALELFADNLSERSTADFADAVGGALGQRIATRSDKVEHGIEEMIQLLAKETAVSPAVADDVYGSLFRALWHTVGRDTLEPLFGQLGYDISRALKAAMPGQKRGAF